MQLQDPPGTAANSSTGSFDKLWRLSRFRTRRLSNTWEGRNPRHPRYSAYWSQRDLHKKLI